MALAFMLALSLAVPVMATEPTDVSRIEIRDTIPGVKYNAYQLLRLVDYDKDVPEGGTIEWYKYEIPAESDAIRTPLMALIGDGCEFAVGRDGASAVNKAGFEVRGSDVMFWVPVAEGKDATTARTEWDAASQEAYMTRFANALREKVETTNLTATKPNVEATGTTLTIDGVGPGYWMVTSSAGTKSMVFTNPDKNGGAMSIQEKNKAPTLKKEVFDQSGKWVDKNDVNIGDTVSYRVEIDAPVGTENLILEDTLTEGLTFQQITALDFYPRGDSKSTETNELGKPARKAFSNSEADGELSNKISLMDAESISLTGGAVNTPNKMKVEVKSVTVEGAATQQLVVKFDKVFLKSLRSTKDNPDVYEERPMEDGDTARDGSTVDAETAAKYNVFLGDMRTQEDDGGTIVVKYTARLNDKAVWATDPQKNSALLRYGHNPDDLHWTDKGPDGTTPVQKVETYTYDLKLLKYATGDTAKGLKGAEFSIVKMPLKIVNSDFTIADADKPDGVKYGKYHTDGAMVKVAGADVSYSSLETSKDEEHLISVVDITAEAINKNQAVKGDKVYRLAMAGDENTTTKVVSDTNGKITIKGLDSDMYVVYEDKAPSGYSELNKPVFVTIGSQVTGTGGDLFIEDVDKAEADGATRVFMATAKAENGSSVVGNTLQIANNSGMVMPTTGGIGTTIFYVVGIALVLGAGVLLVIKKRTGGNEDM